MTVVGEASWTKRRERVFKIVRIAVCNTALEIFLKFFGVKGYV